MRVGLAVAVALGAVLLYPFNQTIAPDWTVFTLDANQRPLPNITVREIWQQYSLEQSSHEEDLHTDATGRVHFDRRVHRSGVLQRFVGCMYQIVRTGVHASCGPYSYLVAFGNGVGTLDWKDLAHEFGRTKHFQTSVLVRRY